MEIAFAVMEKGEPMDDLIRRRDVIEHLKKRLYETALNSTAEHPYYEEIADNRVDIWMNELPSAQPEQCKFEYHYDHTDCIWYRPEARNRCPVTCAQYRDGWNDAMNYIFRDGKGYRPYRRDKQYGE